jgi:uncharacterized phage protein (TIGR01671 family)
MRAIKFRFWSPQGESFVEQYNYNGPVDELFDEREWRILVPSQFTGMKDCNNKEIWEGDIIEFERPLTKKDSKKYTAIIYYEDAAYLIKTKDMEGTLTYGLLHDLSDCIYNWKVKVIGNKFQNLELI